MVANSPGAQARLIALDWGTSVARAYWLDGDGRVLERGSAPLGVQKVAPGGFADALRALVGEGCELPMLACGMIGSRQGWIEVPYRGCPADLATLASALAPVAGARLSIVPGLIARDASGVPDVMRGEETQVFGALERASAHAALRVVVLPGTHSKWALVDDGGIVAFTTFVSGELYGVLKDHSILGRLAAPGDDAAALERGVRRSLADDASLSHDLFSARTLALTGELAPGAVGDYLSGLLLGAELAAGRRWLQRQRVRGDSVLLIGDATLCGRYRRAFALAGIEAVIGPADAAARGLWLIAREAGLVRA